MIVKIISTPGYSLMIFCWIIKIFTGPLLVLRITELSLRFTEYYNLAIDWVAESIVGDMLQKFLEWTTRNTVYPRCQT